MRVICPGCRATYEIPAHAADRLPARLRCSACGTEWTPDPSARQPHPSSASRTDEAPAPAATGPEPAGSLGSGAPGGNSARSDEPRSAAEDAPRMAATALQSAHQQPRAQDLSVRGPERRVDTVGIPAPPHPESRRAETAGPDPTGDGRCAAEAATPAEKAPELPRQPGRQAPAVEARAAMGNDATSERAASAEAAPRRAMRVSSAESAKAHQGTLSAFQAGDTARKSAERGGSGSRGWLSSIVIVLILIGLFLALHGPIAHIWPASLRLYQAIGLA